MDHGGCHGHHRQRGVRGALLRPRAGGRRVRSRRASAATTTAAFTRSSAWWPTRGTICASPRRRPSTSRCRCGSTAPFTCAWLAIRRRSRRGCVKKSAPPNPLFRVTSITSQATLVDRTLLRERLLAMLSGFFALVGLVLAAVGLYGVLSYSVVQRTREIGIRVALGARQLRVVRTVTGRGRAAPRWSAPSAGWRPRSICRASWRRCSSRSRRWTSGAWRCLSATLLLAALLAAALPALRAARVDPVIALRYE